MNNLWSLRLQRSHRCSPRKLFDIVNYCTSWRDGKRETNTEIPSPSPALPIEFVSHIYASMSAPTHIILLDSLILCRHLRCRRNSFAALRHGCANNDGTRDTAFTTSPLYCVYETNRDILSDSSGLLIHSSRCRCRPLWVGSR